MADWTVRALLLVAAGGAIGSALRYLATAWLSRDAYPWGTLAVNLAGSFLIALVLYGISGRALVGLEWRAFLAPGVLGGFTTMSSFAYETSTLLETGAAARAMGYVAVTVIGCVGMALLGRAAASLFA
ncbi:MAG TPA: fluoride efflux transporter CrcB [Candidatus Thermoplasmatota archaeon]|nr:fluoride efflux transporter CrcB [Candidatus Thermoplasmatota archaeon]